MTDEHKDRIYEGVRRMVIWDEPRADIFYRLEVNGIPLPEAQQMHDKARAERMSAIRSDALKQTAFGLALLFAGVGFFTVIGVITKAVLAFSATAAVLGLWHLSKGLFYLLFPHNRKGSLADHD